MSAVALEIEFPLHAVGRLTNISRAVLRQAEYAHELLVVDCDSNIYDLRSNTPVQATLGDVGQSIDFVGYVHHVEDAPAKHPGQRRQRVVCIGPTWRMRQQRQRVWENLTASEIVRSILAEYRLTADVQDTTLRFSHKVQSGESDWAFICRLARESGFVVYPRNTVVHFHERKNAEDQKVASAPVFTFHSANTGYADTEVTEFLPVLGEHLPHPEGFKAHRLVQGVDPRTAQPIVGQHDGRSDRTRRSDNPEPLFVAPHTDTVANSVDEASSKAQGKTQTALWQHRAEAETVGDVTVEPSAFVYMANLPSHYSGFWAVIDVQHIFVKGHYRLRMNLGTDSLGMSDGYVPPANPLVQGRVAVSERPKPTTSLLAIPGNYSVIDHRRTAGGPAPVAWHGSASSTTRGKVAKTTPVSPATLVARARRTRNSGR